MGKIDPNEVRNAFVWLEYNGHEKEIENLLHNIMVLVQLAMEEKYAPESMEWNKRIRYSCSQIGKLNKAYYEAHGNYFTRKYNRDSKKDMSRYVSEVASAVIWQAFSDKPSPDEENPIESE